MNVAPHQEKKKNEKTDKKEAGKERKQATDFKEAACCSSAVVQGEAQQKMVCVRGVPGVTGTTTLRQLLIENGISSRRTQTLDTKKANFFS